MKKNVIKINESTLRQIVSESVKKVLNEKVTGFNVMGEPLGDVEEYEKDFANFKRLSHNAYVGLCNMAKIAGSHGFETEQKELDEMCSRMSEISDRVEKTLYETAYNEPWKK